MATTLSYLLKKAISRSSTPTYTYIRIKATCPLTVKAKDVIRSSMPKGAQVSCFYNHDQTFDVRIPTPLIEQLASPVPVVDLSRLSRWD